MLFRRIFSEAPITIPKFELSAFYPGHNLLLYVVNKITCETGLNFSKIFALADSSTVLFWQDETAQNNSIYVQNRLFKMAKIRSKLEEKLHIPIRYGHVRSEDNPADYGTRGLTGDEMTNPDHIWWKGPSWLHEEPAFLVGHSIGWEKCSRTWKRRAVERFFSCRGREKDTSLLLTSITSQGFALFSALSFSHTAHFFFSFVLSSNRTP